MGPLCVEKNALSWLCNGKSVRSLWKQMRLRLFGRCFFRASVSFMLQREFQMNSSCSQKGNPHMKIISCSTYYSSTSKMRKSSKKTVFARASDFFSLRGILFFYKRTCYCRIKTCTKLGCKGFPRLASLVAKYSYRYINMCTCFV